LYEGDNCEIVGSLLQNVITVKYVTVVIAILFIAGFYLVIIAGDLVDKFVIRTKNIKKKPSKKIIKIKYTI
jgi:hypothetical protein